MDGRIAVVGLACRFPGGANDPEAFWNLLKSGVSTIEEIPRYRFNIDDYWSKDSSEINKTTARKGHFLREGSYFDETFFNISPREAINTDPQHRLLLEVAVEGLDDAGYKPDTDGGEGGWVKSRMGVFVGLAGDSYQNNLASNIDAFFCQGIIRGFASGRLSHHFGWQGPSIVYDSACSSGLVALHAACQSLLLKECDAAVAGSSNLVTSPEMYIAQTKGFYVSGTGGSKTFDETADGYCRGEGVAVLVLKRFADAVRDNDKIDAIILASGTNQSGTSESLTKPHAPTQAALFTANCARAGISPLAVRAVEAHGTGTQAGDYVELEAIKAAYCNGRPPIAPDGDDTGATNIFVSSLKPNVGHSESTAGLASTIKAILMMKHGQIPPHIGIVTKRNPRLGNLEEHGIVIPTKCQPLRPIEGQERIIVTVNNFGAPGGNVSVILQESLPVSEEGPKDLRGYHIVTLSAKGHTPFSSVIERLLKRLGTPGDLDLASISYTTTTRRVDYSSRLALSVSSIDELKQQLAKSPPPITFQGKSTPRIGFVLGGNGSQHKAMAKALYETSPLFHEHIDHCDATLKKHGGPGILGIIMGTGDPFADDVDSLLAAMASIYSVGYALGMLWKEWGVTPSVIVGHSMGEYAGLTLAGCLSVDDAMKLIVCKFRSAHTPEIIALDGGMLAIGLSADDAQAMIGRSGCSDLEVACVNGPAQTCVSGPRPKLVKLQEFLKTAPEQPLTKLLLGQFAWHSSHMIRPAAQLEKEAESVTFTKAITPMICNVDGSVLWPGDVPPTSYLARQLKMPVRFDLCAKHPLAQEVDIWIELSAKAVLLSLLRPFVPPGRTLLPTLGGPTTDCWSFITKALSRLYEAHVPIDWAKYHRPYPVRLVSLPSYPFAQNDHYMPYRDRLHLQSSTSTNKNGADLDREIISTPLGSLEVLVPWKRYLLRTERRRMSPGGYLWLALSCTKSSRITNLEVINPAVEGPYVTVVVQGTGQTGWNISFLQHEDQGSAESGLTVACCRAEFNGFYAQFEVERKLLERSKARLMRDPTSSSFGKAIVPKLLAASNDNFVSVPDSMGHLLESLTVSDDGEEAVGMLHWHGVDPSSSGQPHPSISTVPFTPSELRALLQPACLAFFLSSAVNSPSGAYSIDQFELVEGLVESKVLTQEQTMSAHVLLDLASKQEPVSGKSFIYSQNGSPIARITGFRKCHSPRGVSWTLNSSTIATSKAFAMPLPAKPLPQELSPSTTLVVPTAPALDRVKDVEDEVVAVKAMSRQSTPLPQDDCSRTDVTKTAASLTAAAMTSILAQELGIPEQNISPQDKLEDLGVDSIMSLLLRDRFSHKSGRRLEWFDWKMGMTVQSLWDHSIRAAEISLVR